MPFFFCARMLNFYLRGGGARGMISTYIIST